MAWSPTISSGDVVAIHSALIPTADGNGEILLFGGDDHDIVANRVGQWDHARRFNCRNPTQPLIYVRSPHADLFCCGHGFMGDGSLLTGGGTAVNGFTDDPDPAHPIHEHIHFKGHRRCFAYSPATLSFVEVARMNVQPSTVSDSGGRWYPTLVTLATGEVLAVGGHPAGDDTRHNNNHPERYLPLEDRWVLLARTGSDDVGGPDLFPRLHLLGDGTVFVSSFLQDNARCIAIDPQTGAKRDICDLPDNAYHGFDCPAVLLPLTPRDGYRQRVLLCGGTLSQMIDLGAPAPAWAGVARSGSTAGLARTHASATLLPTGDVVMTGGADPANDQVPRHNPELYNTPIDHAVGTPTYTGGVGSWNTLNDPATVLRNYHSGALLMPDGRIWTAGGNSPSQPGSPPGLTQKLIEIFDPPYPAGARPRITGCPRVLTYGGLFDVQSPDAQQIHAVTLLRCGSSTHAFNPDQRCIFLEFTAESANQLRVTAPPVGTVAPPGNYMLFLIDNAGRPCEYASFVHVGSRTSVVVDRSRYSQRFGDMDGDGLTEIVVTSPWGIGILKQAGATMAAPVLAPNGTRFGGWLLNTADNQVGPVADFDGDGHAEVLVTSPWGIGILKLSGATLTASMMAPNGTRFGGWLLNTADNQFGPGADYDGDGQAEILVTSPWGIGILKLSGTTLTVLMMAPNGTRFGGWLLNTTDNQFGPAADYDGDRHAEILVTSPWGIGILKLSGATLTAPMMQPNGMRFSGWLLNTADNDFGPAADYDHDGRAEIFISSPWGVGILKLVGNTMAASMMQPNGTRFGGWLVDTKNNQFGPAADYDGDGQAELLVTSPWGLGILKLAGITMTTPTMAPNGTRFGGWLLDTADNRLGIAGNYAGGSQANLLVTSPWGLGILRLDGATLTSPVIQPNGTRFDGWLLNTADNEL